MKQKLDVSFQSICVTCKNTLCKNINSYQKRHTLKWNIDKWTMITVSRRIHKCPVGMGTLGIDWAINNKASIKK